MKAFETALREHNIELRRESVKVLQVNIGKRCNQACHHCHVESGPDRTENMGLKTVDRLLKLLSYEPQIHTVAANSHSSANSGAKATSGARWASTNYLHHFSFLLVASYIACVVHAFARG